MKNLLLNKKNQLDFHFTIITNGFVNEKLASLKDVSEDKEVPIGSMLEVSDGKKLLLSKEEGGKVVIISIANK